MKKIISLIPVFLLICSATLISVEVLFNTGYAPYSFREDGENSGFCMDLLSEMMKHIEAEITVTPFDNWEENYDLLQKKENTMIPSLVMNSSRKNNFKWVGPIAYGMTYLYINGVAADEPELNGLDRNIPAGAVKGYYSVRLLEENGFSNLKFFDDEESLFKAFTIGQIYAAPFSEHVFVRMTVENGMGNYHPSKVLLDMDFMYFGFNADTADGIIEMFRSELKRLKENGKFGEIYAAWFGGEKGPGLMTYLTEDYYPSTFIEDGELKGMVGDTVTVLAEKTGIRGSVFQLPWKIAYELSLLNPDVLIFGMARTNEREPLFDWIGRVYGNKSFFFSYGGECGEVSGPEELKSCESIAVTEGWWTHRALEEEGFVNIKTAPTLDMTVENLILGKSPVALLPYISLLVFSEKDGTDPDSMKKLLPFKSYDIYIAASKGTDEEYVSKMRTAFDEISADGTLDEILDKYSKFLNY